jgi:tryptophan-rich sensory protein
LPNKEFLFFDIGMNIIVSVIVAILTVLISSLGGQYFTTKTENMKWYDTCVRPALPYIPRITFSLVWGIIYVCFIATLIHFFQTSEHKLSLVLVLSLMLQVIWCYLYFDKKYMRVAAVLLFVLLGLGMYMALQSNKIWTRIIFVGYVAWLLFALSLNVLSILYSTCQ